MSDISYRPYHYVSNSILAKPLIIHSNVCRYETMDKRMLRKKKALFRNIKKIPLILYLIPR